MHDVNPIYLYRDNGDLHAIVDIHKDLTATILIFSSNQHVPDYICEITNIIGFILKNTLNRSFNVISAIRLLLQ